MSVTYGFFNSLNHDRRYNARQFGSIFDGVINDGVYMSIGGKLMVTQYSGGASMMVEVATGRAWFNHTWTLNDAVLPLEIPESEVILNRIDAVVLEVNELEENRANSIKVVKGTGATNPVNPSLTNNDYVHQYPLAYIYVGKGVTQITTADITNMVGTSSTPFVTGVVQTMNIDSLVAQWQAQWNNMVTADSDEWNRFVEDRGDEWDTWYGTFTNENAAALNAWMTEEKAEFLAWFEGLQVILDGDVAAHLADQILELQKKVATLEGCCETLGTEFMVIHTIDDSENDPILDSDGNKIDGRIIFDIK